MGPEAFLSALTWLGFIAVPALLIALFVSRHRLLLGVVLAITVAVGAAGSAGQPIANMWSVFFAFAFLGEIAGFIAVALVLLALRGISRFRAR